ncbi:hypothetical protein CW304_29165 [Bacillus sp. UFRGS-B20]|nr:hypothetical protein CW304_29165 [Bacillus sp. UFRGS-B20]
MPVLIAKFCPRLITFIPLYFDSKSLHDIILLLFPYNRNKQTVPQNRQELKQTPFINSDRFAPIMNGKMSSLSSTQIIETRYKNMQTSGRAF